MTLCLLNLLATALKVRFEESFVIHGVSSMSIIFAIQVDSMEIWRSLAEIVPLGISRKYKKTLELPIVLGLVERPTAVSSLTIVPHVGSATSRRILGCRPGALWRDAGGVRTGSDGDICIPINMVYIGTYIYIYTYIHNISQYHGLYYHDHSLWIYDLSMWFTCIACSKFRCYGSSMGASGFYILMIY